MTISTELRKAGPFTGNGVTTAFPFSFKVFAATDVAVTVANTQGNESALALGADYAVALNADQDAAPGGTVTLAAPLSTGYLLVVSSAVPNLQPTDITNNGGFYPRVIEDALDRHVAQVQQIDEKVGRALKVAVTSPLGDQALPSPVGGMLIGWNESNDGLTNYAPIGGTLLGQQLAAADGSSLVGFQQAGAGAVVRTAQDKMREWVSVKDFGAVGDGLTDDTSAIQAAINSAAANPMILVPPGSYLVGGLTISQPLTLFGAGWNASKFVAKSGIGDSNMLYASGVSGIVVSGLGFNMRNDEIAGTRATAYIENIACFISCKNVVIRRCCFQKAINHNVIFNAASGAESENIEVADCHFENGARGAVLSARYGKNFHVKNNTMLNVCNQTLSGIDFDKSISLSGVINAIISGNSVSQTIPGGGTIIVEYTDRPSENITISNNAVIGQVANGIKVGASNNVKIYGNTCIDSTSTGIYLEGVYDCSVSNNFVDRSAVNGLRAYEDFQTSRANKNLIIQGNIFKNSNTEGASIGVPNVSQGVAEAYHIAIRQSEHINILDNVFIDDSTSSASGIWMQGQKYTIERNNFLQMKPAAVTLYNTATTVGSEYFIKDNRGMQTTDEGRATIASGSVSVAVSPAVVAESTNARISLSPNTALNGTVAYLFAATSGTGVFAIYARNASHDTPTVSASIDVTWEYSVTDAIGIFGKTSK